METPNAHRQAAGEGKRNPSSSGQTQWSSTPSESPVPGERRAARIHPEAGGSSERRLSLLFLRRRTHDGLSRAEQSANARAMEQVQSLGPADAEGNSVLSTAGLVRALPTDSTSPLLFWRGAARFCLLPPERQSTMRVSPTVPAPRVVSPPSPSCGTDPLRPHPVYCTAASRTSSANSVVLVGLGVLVGVGVMGMEDNVPKVTGGVVNSLHGALGC